MTFFLRIFTDAHAPTLDHPQINWKIQGSTRIGFPRPWKAAISCQDHQATAVHPTNSLPKFFWLGDPCFSRPSFLGISYQLQFCFNRVKRMLMDVGCLHASHCIASNQDSEYLHIFTMFNISFINGIKKDGPISCVGLAASRPLF